MPERTALLVLGLGNVLCGDDGLGATAVHLLQRKYRAPKGAAVIDGAGHARAERTIGARP